MYDVIVVGARCAGSPTAMLLGRKGYRVLLVDKATFPSDIMSTHFIRLPGLARLKRWGLLDRVIASGCPPITTFTRDIGPFTLVGMAPPAEDDVADIYAPRRIILDNILVDAAVEAGVELHEGFRVEEILMDGDRVTGIRGRGPDGQSIQEQARIVIGADGLRSLVARTVQAPIYQATPTLTCYYYGYWSDVPVEGAEIYTRPNRIFLSFPTKEQLMCVIVGWTRAEFESFRANITDNFFQTLDLVPHLAERVRSGKQEERFRLSR